MNLQTDYLRTFIALAETKGYSKIFAKVPRSARNLFENDGYEVEATVPNLFYGREKG